MFIRKGKFVKNMNSEKPRLTNTYGNSYEVSHIMAFVWQRLDGQTSLNSINNEIKKILDDQDVNLNTLTDALVGEMEKVHLIKSIDN